MRESTEHEIKIQDWGETAFLALLEWIYTGRVGQDLQVQNMTELLGMADQYALDSLKNTCEQILIHDVEVENCCILLKYADRHMAYASALNKFENGH